MGTEIGDAMANVIVVETRELLSTDQLCAATGMTYRMADYWMRIGVLTPLIEARGSGTARRFAPYQVRAVRLGAFLRRELNLSLEQTGRTITEAQQLPTWAWDGVVVVDPRTGQVRNLEEALGDRPIRLGVLVDLVAFNEAAA